MSKFTTKQPNIALPGDNGRIIWPFSPPIYQCEITDEEREQMLEHASQSVDNYNKNLAGNMLKGDSFLFKNEHINHWEPILLNKVNMFMAGLKLCLGDDLDPTEILSIATPDVNNNRNLKRRGKLVLESLWVNYQREGDYNPSHIHTGELSMVIFLDVPRKIFEVQANSNTQHSGDLVFYNGERITRWQNTEWPVRPYNNLMFVFPSRLRHAVPPFYPEACRVSVSGNWVVA